MLGIVVSERYFGGLSVEESAEVLGVAPKTVMRDWKMAKSWLWSQSWITVPGFLELSLVYRTTQFGHKSLHKGCLQRHDAVLTPAQKRSAVKDRRDDGAIGAVYRNVDAIWLLEPVDGIPMDAPGTK